MFGHVKHLGARARVLVRVEAIVSSERTNKGQALHPQEGISIFLGNEEKRNIGTRGIKRGNYISDGNWRARLIREIHSD